MSRKSKYTEDFRKRVALAALEDGATLKAVGERFNVNPTLVRNWKLKYSTAGGEVSSGYSEDDVAQEFGVPKYYDADDVEGSVMEVRIEDADGQEYIYWVDLVSMPEDEDEYDWSLERAINHHRGQSLPEPADQDDPEYFSSSEPFSRTQNEFVWVR